MKYGLIGVGTLAAGYGFTDTATLSFDKKLQLNQSIMTMSRGMTVQVSKEDYLKWVGVWKQLYASVSAVIRDLKMVRDGKKSDIGGNVWESIRSYRQSDVEAIKRYATHLLELRAINKILAGRARQLAFEAERAVERVSNETGL